MLRIWQALLTAILILASGPAAAADAVLPRLFDVQGFIRTESGAPLQDNVRLTVTLYDAPAGGQVVYKEVLPVVEVTGGRFSVLLGTINELPERAFSDHASLYVGVRVGTEAELPLQRIVPVPYAFYAGRARAAGAADLAEDLDCTTCVGGGELEDGAVSASKLGATCLPGEVLKSVGGGVWACAKDTDTDTNTLYQAGQGLVLESGTVFSIAPDGVSAWHIKPGAVGQGELASGAVGADNIQDGAVGTAHIADRSVTVHKLAAQCQEGDVLKRGEAGWRCGEDLDTDTDTKYIASSGLEIVHERMIRIAAEGVTTGHIAPGAVDGVAVGDAAIDKNHLKPGAVSADKIGITCARGKVLKRGDEGWSCADDETGETLSYQAGVGLELDGMTFRLSQPAVADVHIHQGAVGEQALAAGSVTSSKIGMGAVIGDKIASAAVTELKIAENAVTSEKIAAGAVTSQEIAKDAVTGEELGPFVVEKGHLGLKAVHHANLNDEAVRARHIDGGVILDSHISANALISPAKIDGTAATLSGDQSFNEGTLFIDTTLDRVGVNTTLPQHAFHVQGTAAVQDLVTAGHADVDKQLRVKGKTTLSEDLSVALDALVVDVSAKKVGIGVEVPGAALDVSGDARVSGDYRYAAEKTAYYPLPGSAYQAAPWQGAAVDVDVAHEQTGSIHFTGTIPAEGDDVLLVAPVNLPEGAVVKGLLCSFLDNNTSSSLVPLSAGLELQDLTAGTQVSIIELTMSASSDAAAPYVGETSQVLHTAPISRAQATVTAWVRAGIFGFEADLRFNGCRVEYAVEALVP